MSKCQTRVTIPVEYCLVCRQFFQHPMRLVGDLILHLQLTEPSVMCLLTPSANWQQNQDSAANFQCLNSQQRGLFHQELLNLGWFWCSNMHKRGLLSQCQAVWKGLGALRVLFLLALSNFRLVWVGYLATKGTFHPEACNFAGFWVPQLAKWRTV